MKSFEIWHKNIEKQGKIIHVRKMDKIMKCFGKLIYFISWGTKKVVFAILQVTDSFPK